MDLSDTWISIPAIAKWKPSAQRGTLSVGTFESSPHANSGCRLYARLDVLLAYPSRAVHAITLGTTVGHAHGADPAATIASLDAERQRVRAFAPWKTNIRAGVMDVVTARARPVLLKPRDPLVLADDDDVLTHELARFEELAEAERFELYLVYDGVLQNEEGRPSNAQAEQSQAMKRVRFSDAVDAEQMADDFLRNLQSELVESRDGGSATTAATTATTATTAATAATAAASSSIKAAHPHHHHPPASPASPITTLHIAIILSGPPPNTTPLPTDDDDDTDALTAAAAMLPDLWRRWAAVEV
ncbi:hypothetical protein UCDDS831_g00952 [Diplodia seriata]|uniref:Uncharacterized protein n=1 Tax=Diplodia seriata TaxID=420778 RepID=A0A0G2GV08_9PEZI|nr:hypothetical protein UCDDS831_g00952 [Diplodia seriata]